MIYDLSNELQRKQAIAFFNIGKELTNSIAGQLATPIRAAMFPGLAKMQNNHAEMEHTLLSALL